MAREYEVRWGDARRFFSSQSAAVSFAKSTKDGTARVLCWGPGYLVWEAKRKA